MNARDWMAWLYLQEQEAVEAARLELPARFGWPPVFACP